MLSLHISFCIYFVFSYNIGILILYYSSELRNILYKYISQALCDIVLARKTFILDFGMRTNGFGLKKFI
jgi:hypothetical protein